MMDLDSVPKKTGRFSSFDGTQVYYEVRGEGRPIIFCYGIACLFNHWTHQIDFFSRFQQTILFDYRGHHQTPIPEEKDNLTIQALADDLIALCEHLNIEKADFVGHSFGVQVLLLAYKRRPDLFGHLVFVNGLYRNPFEAFLSAPDAVEVINQAKKMYNQAPQIFHFLWERGVTNPLLIPVSSFLGGFNLSKTAMKDIEIYARGVSAIDIRVFLTFFEQMIEFNQEELLTKIKVPTLIICGSKDALTPLDEQNKMKELIPNSELQVVPYGSHCTQLDFPEMVNLKIQQFINLKPRALHT
ncbi:MAG: alpha/beta hydrolase [Bdellovibrionales bacterium]|nr:alpha/beta hydrolase [Bdellovibrionales bacterium]